MCIDRTTLSLSGARTESLSPGRTGLSEPNTREMYSGINDLLDWLQDARFVDHREATPLIEVIEELDDLARSGEDLSDLDLRALRQCANSDNERIKKCTIVAMARFGSPIPLADLEELLSDDSPIVRQLAAATAGSIDQAASPAALISLLDNAEEDPEVRQTAALALGKLQHPEVPAALARALKDANQGVRKFAVKAFADLGATAGVDSALETLYELLKDEMPDVRAHAAEALGKIGDVRTLEMLQSRETIEQDSDVLEAIAAAVDDLEEKFHAPPLQQEAAEDEHTPAPEEPPPAVQAEPDEKPEAPEKPTAEKTDIVAIMYQAAAGLRCDIKRTETGLSLVVPVNEQLEHVVELTVVEQDGDRVLRITSALGPADWGNYRQALLLNRHLVFGAISLQKGRPNDTFVLSEAISADHATIEILSKAISYVASAAIQMGKELAVE